MASEASENSALPQLEDKEEKTANNVTKHLENIGDLASRAESKEAR